MARIAEILGTSKISVSRALKGQPGVSDALRQEIRDVASKLGYEYKRLLIPEKEKSLIFLTPKRFYLSTDAFYHSIYYHLNALCLANNIPLQAVILEREMELEGNVPECLSSAGGIIIGGEITPPALHAVAALDIPLVAIDHNEIIEPMDCVVIDNYFAGSLGVEYLYSRGYRRIGFIGSHEQSSNVSDRIYGCLKALRRRKLPFHEDWLISNYNFSTDSYVLNIELPKEMPEAFICHCDRAAYYFIEKLKSEGFHLPEDAAILSIDNTDLAAVCTPSLTSINIDKQRLAEEAFRLLTEQLAGRKTPRRICLDVKIIERDSVPGR